MSHEPPDLRELRALVDWVNLSDDVRELSISYGDVQLFISRDRQAPGSGVATAPASVQPTAASATAPAPAEPAAAPTAPVPQPVEPVASAPASGNQLAAGDVLVKSPMVGTFYGSPKPGDPPFVQVGDTVTADTVLGIVEVMKLMTNIEAKVVGTVARVLVDNEQAVEYGQPLMVITTHA